MSDTSSPPYKNLRRILSNTAIILLLLDIALAATLTGLRLRKLAFINTTGSHFRADVSNAFRWGTVAEDQGIFNVYDHAAEDLANGAPRTIDYPPLRLVAAYTWVNWAHRHYPDIDTWQDDYDFTHPMLAANTIAEFTSSILIFILIRLWIIRMHTATPSPGIPGEGRGEGDALTTKHPLFLGTPSALFGAILFWFNPAVIWDGHCWPQWDVWLIPFFLAAVFLASIDWWFTAGIAILIGAALKGQMLLGAPVLLLWPLCAARFASALKLTLGFIFATAILVLPWMHLEPRSITWCILIVLSAIVLIPITCRLKLPFISKLPAQQRNQDQLPSSSRPSPLRGNPSPQPQKPLPQSAIGNWQSAILLLLSLLLAWPWASHELFTHRCQALIPPVILIIARFFPRKLLPQIYAGVLTGAILLTIPLFNANANWYTIGFKYGTEKYETMITGTGSWNIAKMQQVYFSSYDSPDDPFTIPYTNITIPYKSAARIIYAITLLLCSAGAAWHARRRKPDTRFLAAMATPWLCAFMLLTQMHGRYTIWAAGLSALLAAVSVGQALLGVLLSVIGTLGIMENQYSFVPNYDPPTLQTLRNLDPHLGWAILLIMGIFLYISATPNPERKRYPAGVEGPTPNR